MSSSSSPNRSRRGYPVDQPGHKQGKNWVDHLRNKVCNHVPHNPVDPEAFSHADELWDRIWAARSSLEGGASIHSGVIADMTSAALRDFREKVARESATFIGSLPADESARTEEQKSIAKDYVTLGSLLDTKIGVSTSSE